MPDGKVWHTDNAMNSNGNRPLVAAGVIFRGQKVRAEATFVLGKVIPVFRLKLMQNGPQKFQPLGGETDLKVHEIGILVLPEKDIFWLV